MLNKNHSYHLVEMSPWPLIRSIISFSLLFRIIYWFTNYYNNLIIIIIIISFIIIQWWRDVIRERTFQGNHTLNVYIRFKWGIILFILSEILLFISLFWMFFHRRLSSSIEIGITWPPKGILVFSFIKVPLLNTLVLVSSGITITWAHYRLIENNYKETIIGLLLTILLGVYFRAIQIYEYNESLFTITDSVYGSIFYIITGFHGFHVLVGTLFLITSLCRQMLNHLSINHNFGFEARIWYWHFVDIVWLFLFILIYWWRRYLCSIKIIFNFQLKDLLISINDTNN